MQLRRTFADIIRKELERQNLTQTELAKMTGYSINVINRAYLGYDGHGPGMRAYDAIFIALKIEVGFRSKAPSK